MQTPPTCSTKLSQYSQVSEAEDTAEEHNKTGASFELVLIKHLQSIKERIMQKLFTVDAAYVITLEP